jgi:hypothetical protein
MVGVKLFVEGGGDSEALLRRCRAGFRHFLEEAGFKKHMPRIVACGGRRAAYDRFVTNCEAGETGVLLIDSEDPVSAGSAWAHLANRQADKFAKPSNATDDHCHLMVVCMESWFLADKEALAKHFGQGFNANALPQNADIEAVRKNDLYEGLKRATANCKTKAPYKKGENSFRILLRISPSKVRQASPWAKTFLEKLDALMAG